MGARATFVLLLVAFSGCTCAPQRVEQAMAGVDVVVDADAGRISFARADVVLLDIPVSQIGARDGTAFFDMQFGMFDIQEDPSTTTYTFAKTMRVVEATPDRIAFELLIDEDVLLDGEVTSTTGVVLSLTARGTADRIRVESACTLSHAIGLGAQTHDVDHKGQHVPLWVSEQGVGKTDDDELPAVWQLTGRRHTTHAPIPAFVTDRGAGYVLRSSAFTSIDVCSTDPLTFETWENRFVLEVYASSTPMEAQRLMVDALGRPPPIPPWALAPWHDAIFGEDNVRAVAQRLRDEAIPSSAIWTEDWRGGVDVGGGQYRLEEDWRLDRDLYPNFEDMVADLNALGFQQLVYFNTFVTRGGDVFDEITSRGLTIKNENGDPYLFTGVDRDFSETGLLDLTNPEAHAYMKEHLTSALELGARGWMADFAEWMPVDDVVLASGEDPALVHNRYPVLWQQVNRDAINASGFADDVVVFHRSAHLGSQSLTQVMWAGDQRTSFDADDGLPTIIPIGVGLSTTGFPFYTHDIAGYQSATNDPTDKELFFRWTSLGALSPIMRTHHGTHAGLNVNAFTDDDTLAHYKRWCEFHSQLYPYLRALALRAIQPGGDPMWIPLPLLFPNDDDVWAVKDEVMLGPALLVAPVVTKGAVSRSVTLPSARFAPFFGGDAVTGPASIEIDVPLSEIGLFVVAGGIVPMTSTPVQSVLLESTEEDRIVFVGLGADGTFVEESGASYTLTGNGVAPAQVIMTGNDVFEGDGLTFTTEGHPSDRTITVNFL
jgi:sulfoquinovosidase